MELLGREGGLEFGVSGGVCESREREQKRREECTVGVPVCNQPRPKQRQREDRKHSMGVEIDQAEGG